MGHLARPPRNPKEDPSWRRCRAYLASFFRAQQWIKEKSTFCQWHAVWGCYLLSTCYCKTRESLLAKIWPIWAAGRIWPWCRTIILLRRNTYIRVERCTFLLCVYVRSIYDIHKLKRLIHDPKSPLFICACKRTFPNSIRTFGSISGQSFYAYIGPTTK